MKPLLLLHGALGAKGQLEPLSTILADDFRVQAMNFPGHGGTEAAGEFSIPFFANAVLQQMEEMKLSGTDIFGYSMGGYVAMYLAAHYPDRVNRVVTLGTKYQWNEAVASAETALLNTEKMEAKIPKFVAQLEQRHAPNNWKKVVDQTAAMMSRMGAKPPLGESEFAGLQSDVLLLIGDRDKMVSLSETVDVFHQLPKAQLGVLPNTPHPLESVDERLLAFLIRKFLH